MKNPCTRTLLAAAVAAVLAGPLRAESSPRPEPPGATKAAAAVDVRREEIRRLEEEIAHLAQRLGELSRELGGPMPHVVIERRHGPRVGLGVVLGPPAADGVEVAAVTPGSPAEKAGLRSGDVLQSIDGHEVRTPEALMDALRGLEKDQRVEVGYRRDGKAAKAMVVAGEIGPARLIAREAGPGVERRIEILRIGDAPQPEDELRRAFRFRGFNLVSLDADLGRYFGADRGVLVVAAGEALEGLKSGDVITAVDGEAVDSPREVMRRLGRKDAGEKVRMRVLRDRRGMDLEVEVPEARPLDFLPPPPPAPPAPPPPAAPAHAPAPPPPPPPVGPGRPEVL